jgi:hydroxymethylpyrimidine pyrophosphatase-like HAD family hydrolase
MDNETYKINDTSPLGIAEREFRSVLGSAEAEQEYVSNPEPAAGIANFCDGLRSDTCGLLPQAPLAAEADFYSHYSWCLNAVPSLHEVADHLSEELTQLTKVWEVWQLSEIITNIFLLSCSLADTVDDYLLGDVYDFSKLERVAPFARAAVDAGSRLLDLASGIRAGTLVRLRAWRTAWGAAIVDFLERCFVDGVPEHAVLLEYRDRLSHLLQHAPLPRLARSQKTKIPAFFRSRDFAPADCLELSRRFVATFPEDRRPVLVVGLRTAGSFLAPLSCALLMRHRKKVDWIAIRPSKALSKPERSSLKRAAQERAWVVVVDESIHSGQTLAKTVELLRRSGFSDQDVVVLNPAEPAFPDWKTSPIGQVLPNVTTITLEPAERYKSRLLDSKEVADRLDQYFTARGYLRIQVVESAVNREMNLEWRTKPPERVDVRLKRVYEVHLQRPDGATEVRHVLAKSVGWGWLSYHAFLAAERLHEFVPPLLGLRQGILYMEWIPQNVDSPVQVQNRTVLIDWMASYVAARTQRLRLDSDPTTGLVRERRHKGLTILADSLRRAYNSRVAAALNRSPIQKRLAMQSPFAIMTDSKMSPGEWIVAGPKLLKTDFEHHAQGKNELGITDPAYDLAGAAFHFGFSDLECDRLVRKYVEQTGDARVEDRIFLNKLLVAFWEQNLAALGLHGTNLLHRREKSHQQYIRAWNFMVSESIQECGKLCQRPAKISWKAPLVVTDIDGVLDRMVFGFPSSTAAGVRAISLLHAHQFSIAANTARSLEEVKQYCRSYGFAGGLAEYGAVFWDGVNQRELGLVDPESLEQLAEVDRALREIPGVFLNDDYRYSLRAFIYQNDRTNPLPRGMVQDVLAKLGAVRLQVHHTGLDTAVTAREANKGTGLRALLKFVGLHAEDVTAIGDSEPDLAMFRVARSSFAPGHILCRREARLLGCHIAAQPYQPGLLEIAQRIVHPRGGTCEQCSFVKGLWTGKKNLFVSLLEAADRTPSFSLLRSLSVPGMLSIFRK